MGQSFVEPDEANLDHLIYSDDPIISAFTRWLTTEAKPDEWHLVIEGWNWDAGDDPVWWIVTRPDCDKATALLAFWKAGPSHDLTQPDVEAVDLEDFDLCHAIRQRWMAGFYTRSVLAFELERDGAPAGLPALRDGNSGAVEALTPPDMRRLEGRRLESRGYVQGIPAHLWAAGAEADEFDPFELDDAEEPGDTAAAEATGLRA